MIASHSLLAASLLVASLASAHGQMHKKVSSKHSKRTALATPPTTALTQRDTNCSDFMLITTRGTTEPAGPSFAFTCMIKQVLDQQQQQSASGTTYNTDYPAEYDGMSPLLGMCSLQSYLESTVQACPSTQLVLLGYSQGAYVTSLALQSHNDTTSPVFSAISAIVLLGNPVHQPSYAGNVDGDGGSSTLTSRGAIYSPFTPTVPASYGDAGKVLDVCLRGDTVCDEAGPARNVHGTYGASEAVQRLGAEFILQHLA